MKLLKHRRHTLDFYETPPHFVNVLREHVDITGNIFEPCDGDGAISRHFKSSPACRVATNDIDVHRKTDYHFDARLDWMDHAPDDLRDLDWVVSNPPFATALSIIEQSLAFGCPVAMLLRISFLEPTRKRVSFLREHAPSGLIYLPRYSFTNNGKSDMTTVMWALWNYEMSSPVVIAPRFPNAQRKKARR